MLITEEVLVLYARFVYDNSVLEMTSFHDNTLYEIHFRFQFTVAYTA